LSQGTRRRLTKVWSYAGRNSWQLDPSIMESLTYTTVPLLDSVHPREEKVVMWRTRLSELVKHAIVAVRQYLALYDQYVPLLELDVAEYLARMEEAELSEMLSAIDMHTNDLDKLVRDLPATPIKIGPFAVSCKKVLTRIVCPLHSGSYVDAAAGDRPPHVLCRDSW
jgi:hypothetical protein